MKMAHFGLMALFAVPLTCATAGHASAQPAPAQSGQNQPDSLAAAARRARQKQKEQSNPAKVWDNDNIPTSGGVDVIGKSAQSAPAAVPAGAAEKTSAPSEKTGAAPAQKKSGLEAQLKSAKDDLKNLKTILDFAQRELALDQASYYQKPNYASDTAGAQALKDEQSRIDAKKAQVDAARKKVDDLEAQLESAGGAEHSTPNGDSSGGGNSGTGSAH
jgi:hypothetical protein